MLPRRKGTKHATQCATNIELSCLKNELAEGFSIKLKKLVEDQGLTPETLITEVKELTDVCLNISKNIRTYTYTQHFGSYDEDYAHGYESQHHKARSEKLTSLSHEGARFEKKIYAVKKILSDIPFDYKPGCMQFELNEQIKKVKPKALEDSSSAHGDKFAVLNAIKAYLNDGGIEVLSRVVHASPRYDEAFAFRSETGKLLDRALKLRGDTLSPQVNHRISI